MTIAIAPSASPAATTRLELYVQSLAPTTGRARQEAVVERVRDLVDRGVVDAFDLEVCGERVGPSTGAAETEPGQFLLSRFRAFEQWAGVRDRELAGFERRPIAAGPPDGRGVAETPETGIRFPRVALAEYADDRLSFVAPSREGDETTTVEDRLDKLEC